jgi:hypothetical protein
MSHTFTKISGPDLPDGGVIIVTDATDQFDVFLEDLKAAYPGAWIDDVSPAGDDQ